jgi:hypothetical protein
VSASIARALGPVAWLLACLALSSPALALDSPSAKELWQAYPLKSRTQPTATPGTPAPPPRAATPATHESGSGVTTLLIVLVGVCVAGGIAAIAWRAQRGRRTGAPVVAVPPRMRALVPAMPLLSLAGGGPREPTVNAAQERRPPPAGSPRRRTGARGGGSARVATLPSDPRRAWTAEIEWRPGDGDSRFWVMATADDGSAKAPVAQSAALEWPPSGPAAVQALSDAARALEEALLSAGWTPLPAGEAWYAKRFAWAARPATRQPADGKPGGARPNAAQPGTARPAAGQARTQRPAAGQPRPSGQPHTARQAAAQPGTTRPGAAPRERSGRFKRDLQAWPAETHSRWRCELKWDAGYFNSRFQAVVYPPGTEPGRPVAAGDPFKWTFMSDPDPRGERHLAQVRALASALEAAGWERVDRGPAWYAHRFVWRREGRPPERVEVAAGEAAT